MLVRSSKLISHKWRELVSYGGLSVCRYHVAFLWRFFILFFIFFSLVSFSSFLLSLNPRPFVQSSFFEIICMRPDSHTQLANNCLCPPLSLCFSFDSLDRLDYVAISEYYVPLPVPFCMESALYVSLSGGIFLPCDHGLDFFTSSAYVIIQSIKINQGTCASISSIRSK